MAKKICRESKRKWEQEKLEEIEDLAKRQEIGQLYQKTGQLKKGFQPRTSMYKNKKAELLGGEEEIRKRWMEHFKELLNTESNGKEQVDQSIEASAQEQCTEEQNTQEVREVIKELNNKAPGGDNICVELVKCGGDKLIQLIYELIKDVWRQEVMPKEWTKTIICPIHKKNDKTDCQNYRGISLLSVIYKVFVKILAKRLSPYTKQIIGDYQCGFRRDRSTMDQIFALRSILGKRYEYNIILHQLFIDFKHT